MTIQDYPVLCYQPGCGERARFKIAARWSDGVTHELKTYYLSCEACLSLLFQQACTKQSECPLAPGETLDRPNIFEYQRGTRDQKLLARPDLEPAQLPSVAPVSGGVASS